jgi:diguanylate cyclase
MSIYPAGGETADILFKKADTAMYKAKGTERRVVLFRDSVLTDLGTDSSVACAIQ